MMTPTNQTASNQTASDGDDATTEGASAPTCDPKKPNVRVEWRNMTEADRSGFMDSLKCLLDAPSKGSQYTGSTNRYEDLVAVHHTMTSSIHGYAQFLLWHRYFVWIFEKLLRDECSLKGPMPWWDETLDSGNFSAAPLFTDDYFGPLPERPSETQAYCINPPRLNGIRLHIGPGQGFEERCLSRGLNQTQAGYVTQNFVNDCNARATYNEMRGCNELGPHAYGHNSIGGIMADVSSSVGDPVFFMHHTFVDHAYRIWQNANATRTQVVDGCVDSKSPCTPITNDFVLSSMGLAENVTAGQMINTLGGYLCYKYSH
ncbi:hypothetical protein F4775DRAFT_583784 [Biscogniauxia sp. FL1348]|nr:hypothetical protein F4775DRAFT_583784 [Biscogniauxia sp. FL1348]